MLQQLHYPHDELTLKELSYKLALLFALLSGQRCQTLHCLSVSSMKMSDSKCVFTRDVLLKQSRKGKHLAPLEFLAFPQNEKLCIVSVLKEYLRRTKEIRGEENKLLLSCHVDRPKTMADGPLGGASASADSHKSDETQGIHKSMQTMIGTLVQKVSDIEYKYEELREKAMDEDG